MFNIILAERDVIAHATRTAELEVANRVDADAELSYGTRADGLTPTKMFSAVGLDESALGDEEYYALLKSWETAYCREHRIDFAATA